MYRIYRALELNLRIKPRKRTGILDQTRWRSETQSLLVDGLHARPASVITRSVQLFDVNDGFNREALCVHRGGFLLACHKVKRALEQVIAWQGKPVEIRCNNGPGIYQRTQALGSAEGISAAAYPAGQSLTERVYRAV